MQQNWYLIFILLYLGMENFGIDLEQNEEKVLKDCLYYLTLGTNGEREYTVKSKIGHEWEYMPHRDKDLTKPRYVVSIRANNVVLLNVYGQLAEGDSTPQALANAKATAFHLATAYLIQYGVEYLAHTRLNYPESTNPMAITTKPIRYGPSES